MSWSKKIFGRFIDPLYSNLQPSEFLFDFLAPILFSECLSARVRGPLYRNSTPLFHGNISLYEDSKISYSARQSCKASCDADLDTNKNDKRDFVPTFCPLSANSTSYQLPTYIVLPYSFQHH